MKYSPEYIAQVVDAGIKLLLFVLPLLGVAISEDVKVQAVGMIATIAFLISFLISIFTARGIVTTQGLTATGRYTSQTPVTVTDRHY